MPTQPDDSTPSIPSCLPTDPTGTFQSINATQRTTRPMGSPPPVGFFSITGGETVSASPTPNTPGQVQGQFPPGSPAAYVLHRVIGRGGFGEVWQATQVSIGRAVAVKRLRAEVAAEGGSREWEFRQEALTAAHLEHPNIVPVHDLGVDEDGRPVIAMKMVRGRPWADTIEEDSHKIPVPEFLGKHLPILMATTQAVAFAHSKGIVHRDLKPSQVMVGEFGEVMLMDWGLAVRVGEQPAEMNFDLPTRDSASSPSGTPAYMAPEQTRETAEGIGTWTDVYLLGATLYHLLTGGPPHMADTSREAFIKASKGKTTPPSERAGNREVPAGLEAICMRAMQVKPADRHDSATTFLQALQDYLSGAARRRQSIELSNQAVVSLQSGDVNYLTLGQVEHDCAQALALWPENKDASRVRESAIHRHAQRALAHGDLSLARVQAARLAPGGERHQILHKVEEGELALQRQAAQRRMAISVSFVLLVVLLVASVFFTKRVSAERDTAQMARAMAEDARSKEATARADAENQRDIAQEARAEAEAQRERALSALQSSEDLVKFMLTDLRERLAPRDTSLELLDAVSHKALDHYAAQTSGTLMIADKQRIVPGMLALSEVLRVQGRTEDSLALASQLT